MHSHISSVAAMQPAILAINGLKYWQLMLMSMSEKMEALAPKLLAISELKFLRLVGVLILWSSMLALGEVSQKWMDY